MRLSGKLASVWLEHSLYKEGETAIQVSYDVTIM